MSSMAQQLTVCILTKNEEERIPRAVISVAALGARVLIVDSFSEDETFQAAQESWQEAARSLDDFEFVTQKWQGFVKTRQASLKLIKTRWVMWLDSDEWIEEDLRKWLQAHLEYLDPDNVYCFRRQSFFMGRALKHGGWYPDFKARLCRLGHADWVPGPRGAEIHEKLSPTSTSGKLTRIDAHIGHLPFRSVEEQLETNEAYSSLLAGGMAEEWVSARRRPYSKFRQYLKVGVKFLENYFWKLGFLDGAEGYGIAKGSAHSMKRCIEKARDLYWIQRK